LSADNLAKLLSADIEGWLKEVPRIREDFARFGDRLPQGMQQELEHLEKRLRK